MKLFVIIFSVLFLAQICFSQENDFYDNVINDFSRYSSFIALDVESDAYTGRVIIQNKNLFSYLRNTKGFDINAYKSFAREFLAKKKTLRLKNVSLSESKELLVDKEKKSTGFEIIKNSEEVKEISLKGKGEFINHYFHKPAGVWIIKRGITNSNSIISQLYDWKILTRIDDETGYLIIIGM